MERGGETRGLSRVSPSGEEARAAVSPLPTLRAALALLHPGPSLLVTACFVAAAAAARHRLPDPVTALRLVAIMLPIQLAIGALNDLCDRDLDRLVKPWKPLASGALSPVVAGGIALVGFAVALGMAATFPLPTLPLAAACAAAGIGYDLGLKRGALSWLPYWVGFACLPLTAGATVQHLTLRVVIAAPPLALALALSLQLANSLPDIEGDRRGGVVASPQPGDGGSRRGRRHRRGAGPRPARAGRDRGGAAAGRRVRDAGAAPVSAALPTPGSRSRHLHRGLAPRSPLRTPTPRAPPQRGPRPRVTNRHARAPPGRPRGRD